MALAIILSLLISLITAFFGSLMGLGGGVILVPILILIADFTNIFPWATPQTIVGLSLVVMTFTALSSTLSYLKAKRIDYKTSFSFLIGSIPGGIIGSWVNQFIAIDAFQLYFGLLIILISFLFFLKKRETANEVLTGENVRTFTYNENTYYYRVSLTKALILSFMIGSLSGMFGVGGGSMMVPAMIIFFNIPVHIATATSIFIVLFTSLSSGVTHIALGHIPWEYVLFFIPGAWIGGKLGAKVNQLLSGNVLEWILRGLLIIIGVRMIIEGLG